MKQSYQISLFSVMAILMMTAPLVWAGDENKAVPKRWLVGQSELEYFTVKFYLPEESNLNFYIQGVSASSMLMHAMISGLQEDRFSSYQIGGCSADNDVPEDDFLGAKYRSPPGGTGLHIKLPK